MEEPERGKRDQKRIYHIEFKEECSVVQLDITVINIFEPTQTMFDDFADMVRARSEQSSFSRFIFGVTNKIC